MCARQVGLVDQLVSEAELLPAAEAAMRGALQHPDAGRALVKARLCCSYLHFYPGACLQQCWLACESAELARAPGVPGACCATGQGSKGLIGCSPPHM